MHLNNGSVEAISKNNDPIQRGMARQVIINHAGRRDGYQLAAAFAEAGLLRALITDFYINMDSPFLRPLRNNAFLNKRYDGLVPAGKVKTPTKAIANSFINQFAKSDTLLYKKDEILSNAAYEMALSGDSNLFLYSYTAYEAFSKARVSKLPAQRFLFQMHPAPDYIRDILMQELERYPFAEDSLKFEKEMRDDDVTERLRKEPMLADYIFAASGFTKKSLEATGIPADRIVVTPYGVDGGAFPYFERQQMNSSFRILYVGQFIQRKGVADLLLAINSLRSRQIELTICSRGFFDERILDEFKGLNITIRKNAGHDELLSSMKEADLFVLPSLAEGFGFVIMEAMHSGVPVLTTYNTVGNDIIEDGRNGFLVKPAEPTELAEKIEYAIRHRHLLKEIGLQGHKTAATFTWEKFRRNVISNYLALAK